jgi:hypothetical protein
VKKKFLVFALTLLLVGGFFLIITPSVSSGGISIWPPDMTININSWDYEEEIRPRIQVNNLNPFEIDVIVTAKNPNIRDRKANFNDIPDLSWVKFEPEKIIIPPHGSKSVYVSLSIPEEERPKHSGENWEVWLSVIQLRNESAENPSLFRIELISKCFIRTPPKTATSEFPQFPFLVLLLIIGGFVVSTIISYISKRRKAINMNKSAVFYLKKREK